MLLVRPVFAGLADSVVQHHFGLGRVGHGSRRLLDLVSTSSSDFSDLPDASDLSDLLAPLLDDRCF